MSGFISRQETAKCVFKSCPNTAAFPAKPGLFFLTFNSLPPTIRDEWIRIVARERSEPTFKPHVSSMMCSEHFTPNERSKLCKIQIRNYLAERALIPTVNIGPYDDTLLIKDDDVRDCSQGDDYVCIIENQIQTEEPEPQFTDEKEIDIEDQIQFTLVEKTKHFEGLVQRYEPETTQICHTYNVQNNDDDDVIIIEDDKEVKKSESEYVDQFSQFVKKRDEELNSYPKQRKCYKTPLSLTHETISHSKQLPETKGPEGSNFILQKLLTKSPQLPPTMPLFSTMSQGPRHVVAPHHVPTPKYATKSVNVTKSQEPLIIKEENDEDDDVIIVAEDIEFDVSEDEIEQEYSGQYSQFLRKLNAGTVTKKKIWNSVEPKGTTDNSKMKINSQVASTQHNKPTSLAALQNFTSAPLFMASPMLTAQNGTVKQLIPITPMIATNVGQQVASPQLVALIPSNGVQHNTLFLQDNNLQTYFLSPVVSTTPQLVIDSGQVIIKQEENKR